MLLAILYLGKEDFKKCGVISRYTNGKDNNYVLLWETKREVVIKIICGPLCN